MNVCVLFRWPERMEAARCAGVGECAFEWFLTHWSGIMPGRWKSLRWAASAYAHYLWEHAASWLHFPKTGTQGQREWERATCMLTPSDEASLQLCVCATSLGACESECVRAPTQHPVLSRFQTLSASSGNRQQYPSLCAALAIALPGKLAAIHMETDLLGWTVKSLLFHPYSFQLQHTHTVSRLLNIIITACLLACSLTRITNRNNKLLPAYVLCWGDIEVSCM